MVQKTDHKAKAAAAGKADKLHPLSSTVTRRLIRAAIKARGAAYAPYSEYTVGAALLSADGTVITGCNVENASYGATCCAERNALFHAVAEGHRSFRAIAIAAGKSGEDAEEYASPCGICRQALREFTDPKAFQIILVKTADEYRTVTLEKLLPYSFGPEWLD
ncbi:MAG: cytidine deaminase [Lachnospiraceae bacterium]|nr:cytidine deaminase [Lachnospiraceae bacterium]